MRAVADASGLPNMMGFDRKQLDPHVQALLPEYMTMVHTGGIRS